MKTSLKQVLDWVKEFLRKHPTETIMLDLRPETEQAGHIDNIYRRARKILENEALAINPSTGEPYLYKEPGSKSYFAPYTHMPQLKDCRGKIVLEPYDDAFVRQVGGFTLDDAKNKFDLDYQDKCDYKGLSTDMVANVTKWYNTFNGDGSVKVPTDANTRCDHLWYWELNCTGQCMGDAKNYTFWGEAPHILAEYVNPALVGEGKTFAPEKAGQYIGWVRMDSYEAQYGEVIWRTNFADNAEYCTVTVKSGLDSENYPDQTYKLAKGSSITIPGNIYKQLSGKYLSGWTAQGDNTEELCAPNETFKVNEDITFTAQWLDEGKIPFRIEWKDGDDADKLRAGSVDLNVTDGSGTNTVTLTSKDNWQTIMTATGEVSGIVPNWNRITVSAENPLGTDTVGEYRYTSDLWKATVTFSPSTIRRKREHRSPERSYGMTRATNRIVLRA